MELLVTLSPFVLMGLALLGLWLLLRRRSRPVRVRWGIAAAVALVVAVAWLVLGPDEMSVTERFLAVLPVAAFVVLVPFTIEVLLKITRRQG